MRQSRRGVGRRANSKRLKLRAIAEKAVKPSQDFWLESRFGEGEGHYFGTGQSRDQWYDVPFDTEPELVRTGTTDNYRTVHLQRLANPLLPWNPPPGQIKDVTGTDMNQPNLPVNPYLTVDTSSVDLTAFNGVSDGRRELSR